MNKVLNMLKDKRFIAAAVVTAVTVGLIVVQKKAQPALDVDVEV